MFLPKYDVHMIKLTKSVYMLLVWRLTLLGDILNMVALSMETFNIVQIMCPTDRINKCSISASV
jgi:hypothetical protein